MFRDGDAWKRRAIGLSREPLVHFFVVGALLFVFHWILVGDRRTIVVTPGLKAELARRFRDETGRPPSPPEAEAALRNWERDEALHREALRDRLDRDDPTVRTVLVDKMRARARFELPKRQPSDAELGEWLAAHKNLYDTPLRYDFELVTFAKAERDAAHQREAFERAVKEGANPTTLGHPIMGGNLTASDLGEKLAPSLAQGILNLPPGQWQRFENDGDLLLARVKGVAGGLPSVNELRDRLTADWSHETERLAIDRALQVIVDRYHFEDRP